MQDTQVTIPVHNTERELGRPSISIGTKNG